METGRGRATSMRECLTAMTTRSCYSRLKTSTIGAANTLRVGAGSAILLPADERQPNLPPINNNNILKRMKNIKERKATR